MQHRRTHDDDESGFAAFSGPRAVGDGEGGTSNIAAGRRIELRNGRDITLTATDLQLTSTKT